MKSKLLALLTALFLVTGCGDMVVRPVGPGLVQSDPKQAVKNSIDNTNAALAAVARTAYESFLAGILTRDEAWEYSYKLEQSANYVDKAEALLKAGDVLAAKSQVELAETIIKLLEAELVKRKGQ